MYYTIITSACECLQISTVPKLLMLLCECVKCIKADVHTQGPFYTCTEASTPSPPLFLLASVGSTMVQKARKKKGAREKFGEREREHEDKH